VRIVKKIMESGAGKRWVLPAFIVMGVLCLFLTGGRLNSPARGQVGLQTGGDGRILVVPVQIGRDSYGLAMVDTVAQTLWIYEVNSGDPAHNRLALLAARSWRHDRLLQRYNTGEPKPEQVRVLLENLGQLQKEQSRGKQPASDADILEMAKPDNRALDSGG
jgi:hypothetical protein